MKYALALLTLLIAAPAFAVDFTVSGQGIPTSAASPNSDQGKSLSAGSTLATLIVIANTSNSTQTVTINDCQTTPFYLFKAYPIPALTTWILNLGQGLRFVGCLQWSASATSVMGTISGAQ
jgi:hypothetical protein